MTVILVPLFLALMILIVFYVYELRLTVKSSSAISDDNNKTDSNSSHSSWMDNVFGLTDYNDYSDVIPCEMRTESCETCTDGYGVDGDLCGWNPETNDCAARTLENSMDYLSGCYGDLSGSDLETVTDSTTVVDPCGNDISGNEDMLATIQNIFANTEQSIETTIGDISIGNNETVTVTEPESEPVSEPESEPESNSEANDLYIDFVNNINNSSDNKQTYRTNNIVSAIYGLGTLSTLTTQDDGKWNGYNFIASTYSKSRPGFDGVTNVASYLVASNINLEVINGPSRYNYEMTMAYNDNNAFAAYDLYIYQDDVNMNNNSSLTFLGNREGQPDYMGSLFDNFYKANTSTLIFPSGTQSSPNWSEYESAFFITANGVERTTVNAVVEIHGGANIKHALLELVNDPTRQSESSSVYGGNLLGVPSRLKFIGTIDSESGTAEEQNLSSDVQANASNISALQGIIANFMRNRRIQVYTDATDDIKLCEQPSDQNMNCNSNYDCEEKCTAMSNCTGWTYKGTNWGTDNAGDTDKGWICTTKDWEDCRLNETGVTGESVNVKSIAHPGGNTDGTYFFFDTDEWTTAFGTVNSTTGLVTFVNKIRNGVVIWSGDVITWDNHNGAGGRLNSDYNSGDWEVGDKIYKEVTTSSTCSTDDNYASAAKMDYSMWYSAYDSSVDGQGLLDDILGGL